MSHKPPLGDSYGPVFCIETCTEANPRWRRRGTQHFPTQQSAEEKMDRIQHGTRKRLYRVAEYVRREGQTEEATPEMFQP